MTGNLWWLIHKDLIAEWRARRVWPVMLVLGAVVSVLISLQLDWLPHHKPRVACSLFWLAVFFAGMLAVDRSFAAEREENCWEALTLYPLSPTTIYFAKLIVNSLALSAVQIVLIPLFGALCDMPWLASPAALLLIVACGNVGIAAVGTLVSAVAAPHRTRQSARDPRAATGGAGARCRRRGVANTGDGGFGRRLVALVRTVGGVQCGLCDGRRRPDGIRPGGIGHVTAIVLASPAFRSNSAVAELADRVLALLGIGWYVATESTMGQVQRIVYIHVAVAWFGLWGLIATAACGLLYLLRRQPSWDHWAQAFAELGWLCASLTLVTGSIWARAAWGTWWTWEPRLTTAFILWCIYGGYLIARNGIDAPERRGA